MLIILYMKTHVEGSAETISTDSHILNVDIHCKLIIMHKRRLANFNVPIVVVTATTTDECGQCIDHVNTTADTV